MLTKNPSILENADSGQVRQLSEICFFAGLAAIAASIAIWAVKGGPSGEDKAHAERFGIFVGLWAPTFLILSNRLDRYAEKVKSAEEAKK